jgi:hypothetical protein
MPKDANVIFNDWYAFEVCQAWELTSLPFLLSCYKCVHWTWVTKPSSPMIDFAHVFWNT